MWPAGGEDVVAGGEVEEGDCWSVEVDVETLLGKLVSIRLVLRGEVMAKLPRLYEA